MKKNDYTPSKELFSKCVKAGSRFYYIDAKQDSSGNYYMVVSESRANGQTGNRERQRVFVYQEDLEKFVAALSEVAASLAQIVSPSGEAVEDEPLASLDLPDMEKFLSVED